MTPIRVGLVDDSPFVRRAFTRLLARAKGVELVGEAADGREGLILVQNTRPDVVLLDLSMPVLDGLSMLEELKLLPEAPEVVVVSTAGQRGAEATLLALEAGAFDVIDKAAVPQMRLHELEHELVSMVVAAGERRRNHPGEPSVAKRVRASTDSGDFPEPKVVVVGASTGGPVALKTMLHALPKDFSAPVVVIQHIAPAFVPALAQRLAEGCALPVSVARFGETLGPGVHVVPGGANAELWERGSLSNEGPLLVARRAPEDTPHVPSIDALFQSTARACPGAWGVLLTGMGRDGAQGLQALKSAGGLTVCQDESTSVVFGMPRAAVELNAAAAVLPIHQIGPTLGAAYRRSTSNVVPPQLERNAP